MVLPLMISGRLFLSRSDLKQGNRRGYNFVYCQTAFKPEALKQTVWLLFLVLLSFHLNGQSIFARHGVLDLRKFDFEEKGHTALSGEWELYMSQLIDPKSFSDQITLPGDYVSFPSTWNQTSKSLKPGNGYATYHLRLLVKPQDFSLEIPHFYSNYRLWINGDSVASNGKVGTSEQTSKAQWLPATVTYRAMSDTLNFVLQVSNFHHAKGGLRESILIGTPKHLLLKRTVAVRSNLFLFGGLMLIAIAFIFIYLFVSQEASALYFAGLCFTWALRSVFSNLYVATLYFPDFPWEICVRIEYITLYLTMVWGVFFLGSVFPQDVNNIFKNIFVAFNGLFILLTLFASASLYTQFLPVYLSFCLILLIYIIYVLIHAIVYERHGVWLIVSSILLGVVVFAYDLISYQAFASFNSFIINVGYLIMFLLMGLCLCYQLGLLKRGNRNKDMLTYEDLYGSSRNK
jgi:hypothetical protein